MCWWKKTEKCISKSVLIVSWWSFSWKISYKKMVHFTTMLDLKHDFWERFKQDFNRRRVIACKNPLAYTSPPCVIPVKKETDAFLET
jgi:hypothetical protein